MALIASAVVPLPLASRNFTPMMLAVQLTPTTPTPLPPSAPIVPDTCVPWPLSSIGSQSFVIALNPRLYCGQEIVWPPMVTLKVPAACHTFATRSGWL